MLKITIPSNEMFDERNQKFISVREVSLDLEHSLVSLSKWESKFQKPFLGKDTKTTDEILHYIKCMVVSENFDEVSLQFLTADNLTEINNYIESKQSATTFNDLSQQKGRSEIITSELIYYWMVAFNIPFVCETWHLNRLLTLIRICNVKNSKPKKMSKAEIAQRNKMLNDERRARLGSSG